MLDLPHSSTYPLVLWQFAMDDGPSIDVLWWSRDDDGQDGQIGYILLRIL